MTQSAALHTWDPAHYLKYANQRIRPALDILACIPLEDARRVTDLGCGPGNVVEYLKARYPAAVIEGVDVSVEMLNAAKKTYGTFAKWNQADIRTWQPDGPQDLIYSNAALQWVGAHEMLFPRFMGFVRPGGVLAVQMPNQFNEPSHVIMRAVAQDGPWAHRLKPLLREAPVAEPEQYYDWLKPQCDTVDIWQTAYNQVLDGHDPVLDWISSTALKPLCEALPADQREPFREALGAALREAYPKRQDGTTLFPFKRLFIVAVKAA